MIICVTGGTGFIGRYFISKYSNEHKLIVLTTRKYSIERIGNEDYVYTDYSVDSLINIFKNCDAIVHMASIRPTKEYEKSALSYFENVTVSENIFKAAKMLEISNIAVLSSRSVYNSSMPMPLKEEYTAPYSLYGASKMMIENIGGIYNREYGMKIKFLRLAQVMGIGERRNLMTVFLENSIKHQTLSVYGEGISEKTYVYVKDVSAAIMCAIKSSEESGAFNIAMKQPVSTLKLAQTFCRVFGNEGNYKVLSGEKEDGESWIIDTSKAEKILGFLSAYDIESAIRDMKNDIDKIK